MPDTPAVPRCASCRHWQDTPGDYNPGPHLDLDDLRPLGRTAMENASHTAESAFRLCRKIEMGTGIKPDDLPLAFTMDGSEYRADLRTQASFGCVLHEPLPGEEGCG